MSSPRWGAAHLRLCLGGAQRRDEFSCRLPPRQRLSEQVAPSRVPCLRPPTGWQTASAVDFRHLCVFMSVPVCVSQKRGLGRGEESLKRPFMPLLPSQSAKKENSKASLFLEEEKGVRERWGRSFPFALPLSACVCG